MKNRIPKILLISTLFILLLAACQSAPSEKSPDEVYWEYYQACQENRFETAEKLLTEGARAQRATVGVCGFTHDAINDYLKSQGETTERIFSEEPELTTQEDEAFLTWVDDTGNIANVILVKTDDGWKVDQTVWSN
jgi:hypothetical protein